MLVRIAAGQDQSGAQCPALARGLGTVTFEAAQQDPGDIVEAMNIVRDFRDPWP